jgi:hypothetical protein
VDENDPMCRNAGQPRNLLSSRHQLKGIEAVRLPRRYLFEQRPYRWLTVERATSNSRAIRC